MPQGHKEGRVNGYFPLRDGGPSRRDKSQET